LRITKGKLALGVALAIIILSSSLLVVSNADQSTVVKLSPTTISDASLKIGSTFPVSIQISNVTRLWGWSLSLTWDPSVLQVANTSSEGPFLSAAGQTSFQTSPIDNEGGQISNINDVLLGQTGASGSGDLAYLTFQVVGYGSTQIKLLNLQLLAQPDSSGHNPSISSATEDAAFTSIPQPNSTSVSQLAVQNSVSLSVSPMTTGTAAAAISLVKAGTTSQTSISLGPSPDPLNTKFDMDLRVDNAADLWAWAVNVTWNPAVLKITKVVQGDYMQSDGVSTLFIGSSSALFNNTYGTVDGGISCTRMDASAPTDSSGVLATLTFQVIGYGTASITLPSGIIKDESNTHAISNPTLGSPATITATGSSSTYSFTFSESGLPSGTSWSINCHGATQSATAPASISFTGLSGSNAYTVGSISGYSATPSSGTVSSGGTQAIAFAQSSTTTYTFTFSESGLPSGASWGVTCNGQSVSSSTGTLQFSGLAAGSYPFTVSAPSGYSATPSTGSIQVSSSSLTQAITFAQSSSSTYTFTFGQIGLPSGTSWTVNCNGLSMPSTTLTVQFAGLAAGTYPFSVTVPIGYSANPTSGNIQVSSTSLTQSIVFTQVPTYNYTFYESGLPAGSSWRVTVDGQSMSSTDSSIQFIGLVAGTHPFTATTVLAYTASPSSGQVTIGGSSSSQSILFSPITYTFTFSESGLPSGASWGVTCNGQSVSSSTGTLQFSGLAAGSYAFNVTAPSGYSANPSSGNIQVSSSSSTQSITFSAVTYSFTFTETGLPSGTSWSITCNGQVSSSVSTTITLFGLIATTYQYAVTSPGYFSSPSSGQMTITNSSTNTLTVTFTSLAAYTSIDVYTNKGGKGQNVPSDAFGPQELVQLYASVTYRGAGVVNTDVAFIIENQNGITIATRVGRTDSNGTAYAEYRLPWPDGSNPEVVFGKWSIVASVNVSQVTVSDSLNFVFNYIINSNGISVPSSVQRGTNLAVAITINNIENAPVTSTVTMTIYDEARVPIGSFSTTCTNNALTTATVTATIPIPTWTFVGQATVYVDILTNTLSSGGVPYCPEKTATFQIVA